MSRHTHIREDLAEISAQLEAAILGYPLYVLLDTHPVVCALLRVE